MKTLNKPNPKQPNKPKPEDQTISAQAENAPVVQPDAPLVRVSLRYGYRGHLTEGAFIEPGVYAWGDPALFGIAEYLIENNHARLLGDLE